MFKKAFNTKPALALVMAVILVFTAMSAPVFAWADDYDEAGYFDVNFSVRGEGGGIRAYVLPGSTSPAAVEAVSMAGGFRASEGTVVEFAAVPDEGFAVEVWGVGDGGGYTLYHQDENRLVFRYIVDGDLDVWVKFSEVSEVSEISEVSGLQQIQPASGQGFLLPIVPIPDHVSPEDIMIISTQAELAAAGHWQNEGRYFVLANDIHMIGSWSPIPLVGTFDGRGHTIHNLVVHSANNAGLFSGIGSSTIKNLGVRLGGQGINTSNQFGAIAGGLVATAFGGRATILNSFVIGNVNSSRTAGGLVGNGHNVDIRYSYFIGNMRGEAVGGLMGYGGASIYNSFAEGSISADRTVGGLIGDSRGGEIRDSHATVNISAFNSSYNVDAGGLAGGLNTSIINSRSYGNINVSSFSATVGGLARSANTIENSYALGNVSVQTTGAVTVGGLAGSTGAMWTSAGSEIVNSQASGDVTVVGGIIVSGRGNIVGGLLGFAGGETTIVGSRATGDVTSSGDVGGLVGRINGTATITNAHAEGNVRVVSQTVSGTAGGLIGEVTTLSPSLFIENSTAAGNVQNTSTNDMLYLVSGGLVGRVRNTVTIIDSHATGEVSGRNVAGGLIGNGGFTTTITNSHATGNVYGNDAGGLVGLNIGNLNTLTIDSSSATGNVNGNNFVGGLVGRIDGGEINNSRASGDVTSASAAGGLVGHLGNSAQIFNAFASGNVRVQGWNPLAGGLVGAFMGTEENRRQDVVNSFRWINQTIERFDLSGNLIGGATNTLGDLSSTIISLTDATGQVNEEINITGTFTSATLTPTPDTITWSVCTPDAVYIHTGRMSMPPVFDDDLAIDHYILSVPVTLNRGGQFTITATASDGARGQAALAVSIPDMSESLFLHSVTGLVGTSLEMIGTTVNNFIICYFCVEYEAGEEYAEYCGCGDNIILTVCDEDAVTIHRGNLSSRLIFRRMVTPDADGSEHTKLFIPVTLNQPGTFTITATSPDGSIAQAALTATTFTSLQLDTVNNHYLAGGDIVLGIYTGDRVMIEGIFTTLQLEDSPNQIIWAADNTDAVRLLRNQAEAEWLGPQGTGGRWLVRVPAVVSAPGTFTVTATSPNSARASTTFRARGQASWETDASRHMTQWYSNNNASFRFASGTEEMWMQYMRRGAANWNNSDARVTFFEFPLSLNVVHTGEFSYTALAKYHGRDIIFGEPLRGPFHPFFVITMNTRTINSYIAQREGFVLGNVITGLFAHELGHVVGLADGLDGNPLGGSLDASLMNHGVNLNTVLGPTAFDVESINMRNLFGRAGAVSQVNTMALNLSSDIDEVPVVIVQYPQYGSITGLSATATDIIGAEVMDRRVERLNMWISEPPAEVDPYSLFTVYRIKITEAFQGDAIPGDIIEIKKLGGQLGNEALINNSYIPLTIGDNLVMFLSGSYTEGLPHSLLNPYETIYRFLDDGTFESLHPQNNLSLTAGDLDEIAEGNNGTDNGSGNQGGGNDGDNQGNGNDGGNQGGGNQGGGSGGSSRPSSTRRPATTTRRATATAQTPAPTAAFTNQLIELPAGTNTAAFTIATENIPDGNYTISTEGLPYNATIPAYITISDNESTLQITNLSEAPADTYTFTLTIYDEDGSIIITTETFTLTLYTPVVPEPAPDPAPIQPSPQTTIRLAIDNPTYTINGQPRTGGAAPFIDPAANRTMVPLRIVAEALGADVNWLAETRTVTVTRGGTTITLPIGEPLPGGMGTPVIVNDRTFVPIAYVIQMLEADIHWDADNRAVYIRQPAARE